MAASVEAAQTVIQTESPNHAVVDLKLGSSSGLSVVQALHAHDATMLIVVLTGFASIATAVEAIKLGACNYLVKPSNTRSEEHTSELPSLMRISYAVFCLKKQTYYYIIIRSNTLLSIY